jgi:hypothetical protein
MDSIGIKNRAAKLGALLLPGLILMGCDAKHPERVPALSAAAVPAPRTLDSTLRLHPDAQDIPFNPEIAGDAYGNAVAALCRLLYSDPWHALQHLGQRPGAGQGLGPRDPDRDRRIRSCLQPPDGAK